MINDLRILHLAMDEKFIDQAYRIFEEVAPGANDIFLYSLGKPRYTKTPPKRTFSRFVEFLGLSTVDLSAYDLVVVHSLHPAWWKSILKVPRSVPVLWLGWGYDYYDLVGSGESGLLLPDTKAVAQQHSAGGASFLGRLKQFLKRAVFGLTKEAVIKRVDYFAPVLPAEYEMVRQAKTWKRFPSQLVWNYGNLEDDLIKGFEGAIVCGSNILVGNSASPTNNHLEAFSSLSQARLSAERKIIAPLSYGIADYRAMVIEAGLKSFADRFQPLIDFMPIEEYVSIISSCSHVVMNHVRQQALGNIVIMLYLGAKVFVREESPVYIFFKSQGTCIFSIQQMEQEPSLLNAGLLPEEIQRNRDIVISGWSRLVSQQRTHDLLAHVFSDRVDKALIPQ